MIVVCVIGLVRVFGEGVEKSRVKFWGFFFWFFLVGWRRVVVDGIGWCG